MKLLELSQLRFLLRTPWSTLTVWTGIALGIASVVAVHQISLRVDASLASVTPAHLANVSFLLEKPGLSAVDYFSLRRAWRAGEHPEIRWLMPIVEGEVHLRGRGVSVIGVDALAGDLAAGARGAATFLVPRSVVASVSLGMSVAEKFSVAGVEYSVAAIFEGSAGAVVFTDLGTAQELLGMKSSELSRLAVSVADPWAGVRRFLDRLLPGFAAGFAMPTWLLDGWQVRSLDTELPSLAFARSVLFNLGALGTLALVVSWLLVYQVSVIWLRRRRRTMERLHLLGVSKAELAWGFLRSLLVLGLAATLAGIVAGYYLAQILSFISTAGLAVAEPLPGLDRWVLLKAGVSGVAVSLLGGALAFHQEWRVADPAGDLRRRIGQGVAVCLLLGMGVAGTVFVTDLWGGFLSILTAGLATVVVVRPLLEGLNRQVRAPWNDHRSRLSLLARLGLRELVWYPRDLAVAIGALALAVSTSVAIGLMVDSFRNDFSAMLDQRLAHDLFVRADPGAGPAPGPVQPQMADVASWLAGLAPVAMVQAYGHQRSRLQGRVIEVGFTQFTAAETSRYGVDGALETGEALLSERLARDLEVGVGDSLTLAGSALRVRGIFPGFGDLRPRVLIDMTTASELGIPVRFDRLSVMTDAVDVVARQLKERYPELGVQRRDRLRQSALQIFDQTFSITQALTLVALVVASIGLYNALLGLKLNQGPTLALLEAMGVSERERQALQLWRALGVGATVLFVALPIGIVMAWLLCTVVNPRAFGWSLQLTLSPNAFLTPLVTGLVAIAVTSLLPTPRERLGEIGEGG